MKKLLILILLSTSACSTLGKSFAVVSQAMQDTGKSLQTQNEPVKQNTQVTCTSLPDGVGGYFTNCN